MRTDFPDFLLSMKDVEYVNEDGNPTPVFMPENIEVSDLDLCNAERRLGTQLPPSYRAFLRILGPGDWCMDHIPAPDELQAFDSKVWGIAGFIPLVDNVLGVGDTLAINPTDPHIEAERPVYYCGHDPFGHARIAESFEDWCRATAAAQREKTNYYGRFEELVWDSWRAYRRSHPWWKFWSR